MAVKISVVVACKNERRDIPKCIEAILRQSRMKGKFEAIFVDGGSTDGTVQIIHTFAKKNKNFRLIRETGPMKSAANARNLGAKASHGDILVFFDADAVPDRGYLYEISRLPRGIQAASSNVRPFPSKRIWAQLREYETLASNYLISNGNGIQFPNIFRREFFIRMGGYHAKYTYGEDLQLLERMKKEGIIPANLSRAVIFHRDPDSLSEISAQSRFWGRGFFTLFASDPKRHVPRLALVAARALWLPLYFFYIAYPFKLLLFVVAALFLASVVDGLIQLHRSTRMGADFSKAILIMPFRMVRSVFFLQGFTMGLVKNAAKGQK